MSYCPDCGTEVETGANFCPDCGNEVKEVDIGTDQSVEAEETESDGVDIWRGVASVAMSLVVSFLVLFAFSSFTLVLPLVALTILGVSYYLYNYQETTRLALGMGLYITALWLPIVPLFLYIGPLVTANPDTTAGAGQALGSVIGMVIFGFIGLIVGLVVAAIGYFLRKGERE